jgi:hypothetical protein
LNELALFCKSYRADLERAATLVESVRSHNRDDLPIYIAVPQDDLVVFRSRIGSDVEWLSDDAIVSLNPTVDVAAFAAMPGHLSQQVVKAEFWRTGLAQNCFCIDSDSRFIREFGLNDLLAADGTPYTVLHEGKGLLEFWRSHRHLDSIAHFEKEAGMFRELFQRTGPLYFFGPLPVIWNREVWSLLADEFAVRGSNIVDEITRYPLEASWYGEALLKHRPFDLLPREPLFKAYLYLEEYEFDRRRGIGEKELAEHYLGVVMQSNWYPKRLRADKRLAYKIKRWLRHHRR